MPKSKQPNPKSSGELLPPSSTLDKIDWHLRDQLRAFPTKGELDREEIEHWHQDLGRFPVPAIDWAFESYRRSGRFFPVYGQILDLLVAWEPPASAVGQYVPGCSKECRAKHGRGYHGNDMVALFKMYVAKRAEVNGPLKKSEILVLFDELDKRRGKIPDWRKTV